MTAREIKNHLNPKLPPPTPESLSQAVSTMLDNKAKERQYDSIQTAISYKDDPNQQYASEATALLKWRSDVWTYATEQINAIAAGTVNPPSSDDFIAAITAQCPFEWPSSQPNKE